MLTLYISALDQALLITTLIFISLGLIILILCGFYKVGEDRVIIIEKSREFYKECHQGIYFFFPIIYQRVGSYIISPLIRRYTTRSNVTVDIVYQVIDVKKFHYSHLTFENIMQKIEKENSDINIAVLTDNFTKYGLKFININKVKN